ncbi:MAG: CoA transferase [Betaproteobacteria bacterium]|nr:CoA transferase [Betaproteobacteria bacterium]
MTRPLSHIRVLDLTRVLAGPWAAQNLADLGAEVIKIERPGTGDDTRTWGPPWLKDKDGKETRESAYFLSVNRGKKSLTVDISKPDGQALIRKLAAHCDVLLENYKVGDLQRYGLGYDDLAKINPGLIYCSVTGFGQDGPYANRPGYDFVFQGMGGLMSITGERDELPGGGPQKVGIAVTDVLTGMYASLAVTSALTYRQISGIGQYIDMALFDSIVAFNANQMLNFWVSGNIPKRWGNAHVNITPYEVFASADGFIILAVGNDSQFASFCNEAGRPELATDARFKTNPERLKHRDVLIPIVKSIILERPSKQWIRDLEAANVPCGAINNMQEVFEDLHVQHRNMRVDIPHPLSGTVPSVASPMKFSATPVTYDRPPPLLGQHTDEILRGLLGLDGEEIGRLRSAKII